MAAGICYAVPVADLGWNQGSHFALTKSLFDGSARIDTHRWMTGDVAYVDGHFYSTKAPGLALVSLPAYSALRTSGLEREVVRSSRSRVRATRMTIWALRLSSVVVPAMLLLVLVRAAAERIEPGLGIAAATTVAFGTLVLPFATLFFAHILSALLGFAAFTVLWRERDGPGDIRLVAVAGLLVGLAVTTEYPLVLIGIVLAFYATVARPGPVRRAFAYAIGTVAGVAPLLLYNRWAFGSALHLSYTNAVRVPGETGHDVLGANTKGFFGVGLPDPRTAIELLFASRGLFTIGPVIAMGVAGTAILFRRGHRAEALVVASAAACFWIYNAGYDVPFGGWVPGPRFLIPILPFLGFPLAVAYRTYPVTTLGLAAASVVMLASATATVPLLPSADTSRWADRIQSAEYQDTITIFFGVREGWLPVVPFIVPALVGVGSAALATRGMVVRRRDVASGFGLLAVWALGASLVPRLGVAAPGPGAAVLVACATGIAALVVTAVSVSDRALSWLRDAFEPSVPSR